MGGNWSIALAHPIRQNGAMRVVLLSAIATLSACAPVEIYYKPGAQVARMEADTQACRIKALRSAPVDQQIRQTPPRFVPGRIVCDSNGENCQRRVGYWIPGETYRFDANEPLRGEVEKQCMAQRGYRPASIPLCTSAVAKSVKPARTKKLPALSNKSCAIRNQDGSFQIVTLQ